jgi:hypothetical protein
MASTPLDAKREARAARREHPNWSLERTIRALDGFAGAVVGHVDDGVGGLAELHAVVELHRKLGAAIDTMARRLLTDDDYSYREVGEALGITRQAIQLRYRGSSSRPAGGQPGNLR